MIQLTQQKHKRLAVARFWYEASPFASTPCTLADFQSREWLQGREALEAARDTATEMGAVHEFARTHPDWEVVVLRCASALASGPIDDEVYEAFKQEVLDGLAAEHWDAVYLSLHGAAITRDRHMPDLDLVRSIRQALPGVPLGASFGLHANLPMAMGPLLDMASAYKTYPHIDMAQTAQRVLSGLVRIVEEGLRTEVTVHKPGLVLTGLDLGTDEGPMRELQELASAVVADAVLEVSVMSGFPYAGTADTGAALLTVAKSGEAGHAQAMRASRELLRAMHERVEEFQLSPLSTKAQDLWRSPTQGSS